MRHLLLSVLLKLTTELMRLSTLLTLVHVVVYTAIYGEGKNGESSGLTIFSGLASFIISFLLFYGTIRHKIHHH